MTDSAPTAVVERFIDHLRTVTDNDAAVGLLAGDVVYENSWLPTVRGRERYLVAPLLIQFSAEPFEYPREWPANVRLAGPALWEPQATESRR